MQILSLFLSCTCIYLFGCPYASSSQGLKIQQQQATDTSVHLSNNDAQQFLIPLLTFGPNNQIQQLKWVLMLAKMLNRTVLLTGIFEHYLGLNKNESAVFLPPELLFNTSALSEHLSISTFTAAKSAGWDGEISAFLKPQKALGRAMKYWSRLAKVLDVKIAKQPEVVKWSKSASCSIDGVKDLQLKLKGHSYVLVWPSTKRCPKGLERYDPLEPPWRPGSGNPCKDGYASTSSALTKSETLRDAAGEYIESEFENEPFVAAHVRPFPDTCLAAWSKEGNLSLGSLRRPTCHNGRLFLDLVHTLTFVMDQHKVKRLFILAHPQIRDRINLMLSEVQVRASYLDPETPVMQRLSREAGIPSRSSLLLFVEQAIALQAVAFIGTESSTASWTILQERQAALNVLGSVDSKTTSSSIINQTRGQQTEYLFNA